MLGLMQDHPLLISSIITHAARHHGDTEIVSYAADGLHVQTCRQAERRTRALARALLALGVQPGTRVATLAWNDHRHFELYYAVSGIGAVCHTLNPRLSDDDLLYLIRDAQDRVLFLDPEFVTRVQGLLPQLQGQVRDVIVMCHTDVIPTVSLPEGVRSVSYETLLREHEGGDFTWPVLDERAASSLCYTSGTTGRPKGVLYSHRSTLLHALSVQAPDVFGLSAVDRVMPIVPMFHVNAWGLPYAVLLAGATLVLPGRSLDGPTLARRLDEQRVTCALGVPTVWLGLLDHLERSGARLQTLKRAVLGGAACSLQLLQRLQAQGLSVRNTWGMTEISPLGVANAPTGATLLLDPDAAQRQSLKPGRVPFGIDLRIVDENGREQPWDGKLSGRLQVRGHWVLSGYLQRPEAVVDADGWFDTGDIANFDALGFMQITDRAKEVIKSGGEWISSLQLEALAASHPAVAQAAAIGAQHPRWGERPVLIVAPKQGTSLDSDQLLSHIAERVPKWWIPDAIVVVEQLPLGATGKVLKSALRERYGQNLVAR